MQAKRLAAGGVWKGGDCFQDEHAEFAVVDGALASHMAVKADLDETSENAYECQGGTSPRTEGPVNCHQDWLAGYYFQSSLCGLPVNLISLILAFPFATPSPVTVVCYQSDRDELRRRVIQWLEAEIIPDGWFSKGSNYSEVLDKYFKSFDDGDSRLDSTEFLKFVEQNETAVNITTYMDQETNKLLRGLCVDALIELSDENADWKLSFNEFLKCLSPSFNPPEKKCALEDESYEDGAETQVECNRCVCACGNWVCTAMTCEGKNGKVPAQRQRPDQDLTEEELARYVQELQKHQETAEKTKRMSTKEM
ncbi:follistatin-related protein 1 [Calypte anna]|uniref:follistatin-related protein 1 n=1 Tax=Calypte anna TaxID=9244 RepID=UPI0011C3A482|nr:follistatin-related protein 1 [Calypte anna]